MKADELANTAPRIIGDFKLLSLNPSGRHAGGLKVAAGSAAVASAAAAP